jgi:hypothetical protein
MGKISDDFNVVSEVEVLVEEQESQSDTPAYGSDEWNNYVMSLFHADEMIDGNPLCHGLRRVANLLLGSIVSSKPTSVFPSTDPNGVGRATVVYEITFDWGGVGDFRTYGDVAEVWHGNTEDLYAAHAVACASTKAEARTLRKALMVKCVAAEELANNKDVAGIVRRSIGISTAPTTGEIAPADVMSDNQFNFIDSKCRQLQINPIAYANDSGFTCSNVKEFRKIKKMQASTMIQKLNDYQTNGNIPEGINGYSASWKE